jgi:hypothetical protein
MNEIRPHQPPASNPPRFDDEIDLVDLAVTLWRRKWIVFGVFFLVLFLALVFAYSSGGDEEKKIRVSSLYEIPAIVFPGADSQRIQYVYEPKALKEVVSRVYVREFARAEGSAKIDVEIPKDTNLLALSTDLPAADESRVDGGVNNHEEVLERIEGAIEARVGSLLDGPNSDGVMVFGGGIVESARVESVAADVGPSKALIIALGAILGLFAGLFAALMVGFVSAARDRLHETESTED